MADADPLALHAHDRPGDLAVIDGDRPLVPGPFSAGRSSIVG